MSTKIKLEREYFSARYAYAPGTIEADVRRIERDGVLQLEYAVFGQRQEFTLSSTVEVTATACVYTPASWWQHFKQDCFPAWALRLWPVQTAACTAVRSASNTVERHITAKALFPTLQIPDHVSVCYYEERGRPLREACEFIP